MNDTRDALWWEVQRRIARTPALIDLLLPYLRGTEDFSTAALDALEEAEALECGGSADHDGDQDEPHKTAAENALARYGQGEPAARVLVDLLDELLGATALENIERVRLSAQCEALRSWIQRQHADQAKLADRLDKDVQELARLEAALAALAPLPAKTSSPKG